MDTVLASSNPATNDRRPERKVTASVVGLFVGFALLFGAAGGYLIAPRAEGAPPSQPYLDAEWDYLGAMDTWPAAPDSTERGPFGDDFSNADLVAAGRVVCTRSVDPGMSFDGMLDLLKMTPHQTYVVMTESADKLCPSQQRAVAQHLE